jgi:hypothetical protein
MFGHCQHLVQKMAARSRGSTKAEQKLTQNIVASIVRTLQELSTNFKQSQSSYLRSEFCIYHLNLIVIFQRLRQSLMLNCVLQNSRVEKSGLVNTLEMRSLALEILLIRYVLSIVQIVVVYV